MHTPNCVGWRSKTIFFTGFVASSGCARVSFQNPVVWRTFVVANGAECLDKLIPSQSLVIRREKYHVESIQHIGADLLARNKTLIGERK